MNARWLVGVGTLLLSCAVAHARESDESASSIGVIQPSALLSIDQNRATVIDRIVAQWGNALSESGAGVTSDQLRTLLDGLRADHLLAASLAGNLEGLRNVIALSLAAAADVKPSLLHTKALGDTADDLTYTPVTPCRLVDTRIAGGALGSNTSRNFKVWVSSGGFTAQGGDSGNCNVPANPAAVVLNVAAVNISGLGNLIAYPTGGALPNTSVLNYQGGTFALSNGAIIPSCVPNCANQITIKTNGAGADVVIDIVGYLKPAVNSTTGAFEVSVNNNLALQISPDPLSPLIVAGSNANSVTAGASGAVIDGGGATGTQITLGGVAYSCGTSCANRATDAFGTVSGGAANQAGDGAGSAADRPFATVGGGLWNAASGIVSTVAGGSLNNASGDSSTIAGGLINTASGFRSAVGGGQSNTASNDYDTVAGGYTNKAQGGSSTVGGGSTNTASGAGDTIGGGYLNSASGNDSTIAGGQSNTVGSNHSTVGGGLSNVASGTASTVAGGQSNTAMLDHSTVAGGQGNTASGGDSTVSGGFSNEASGGASTVAGGEVNHATASHSTVAGGVGNTASGAFGFVAGGSDNVASGASSFAAGEAARALHDGEFVWADASTNAGFDPGAILSGWSNPANTFNVRATGGVWFVTGTSTSNPPGCSIGPGGGAWGCSSSRDLKSDFENIDVRAVLDKVLSLPMQTWRFKTERDSIRHLGPMAQDFHAAFGLGDSDRTIGMQDADGVALAAIQGLHQLVQEKDARIATLEQEVAELRSMRGEVAALKAAIAELVVSKPTVAQASR